MAMNFKIIVRHTNRMRSAQNYMRTRCITNSIVITKSQLKNRFKCIIKLGNVPTKNVGNITAISIIYVDFFSLRSQIRKMLILPVKMLIPKTVNFVRNAKCANFLCATSIRPCKKCLNRMNERY